MRTVLRTGIGIAIFAGGLTFLVYGIAQAIENGNCGTDKYGRSIGPPCPSGFGPMIALMILGVFAALLGAGIASKGAGTLARLIGVLVLSAIAGVVLGIVDLDATDTRPGLEIVIAVVAPLLLFVVPALGRAPRLATATPATSGAAPPVAAPPPPAAAAAAPRTGANAEDVAARLRQLEQLRESGLLDDAAFKERRAQILAEL